MTPSSSACLGVARWLIQWRACEKHICVENVLTNSVSNNSNKNDACSYRVLDHRRSHIPPFDDFEIIVEISVRNSPARVWSRNCWLCLGDGWVRGCMPIKQSSATRSIRIREKTLMCEMLLLLFWHAPAMIRETKEICCCVALHSQWSYFPASEGKKTSRAPIGWRAREREEEKRHILFSWNIYQLNRLLLHHTHTPKQVADVSLFMPISVRMLIVIKWSASKFCRFNQAMRLFSAGIPSACISMCW